MDVDLKIRKIMQDYQLNGDATKAKNRLGGLMGFVVIQTKLKKINQSEIDKIRSAYKNVPRNRNTTWKTRMIFR